MINVQTLKQIREKYENDPSLLKDTTHTMTFLGVRMLVDIDTNIKALDAIVKEGDTKYLHALTDAWAEFLNKAEPPK